MLATLGCQDSKPFFLISCPNGELHTVWFHAWVQSTCVHVVTGEGCWFISCWALNWCILYEILPCHFSVSELGPSAVTIGCHLQTTGWLHALQHRSLQHQPGTSQQKCSIPCLWLVTALTFPNSYWFITREPRSTCARICAARLGLVWHPVAAVQRFWLARLPEWSSLIGWASDSAFSFLPVIPGQEVRTRHWRDCEIFAEMKSTIHQIHRYISDELLLLLEHYLTLSFTKTFEDEVLRQTESIHTAKYSPLSRGCVNK